MGDPNAGWEHFRSDIRGSMAVDDTNQRPILQFHIPIHRFPKYRPGQVPPPPPVNLRLVHDSDAFIIDKVVLPRGISRPHNGSQQRRCYYIIGWPDLPAARPVVDASKILDYVSPRTFEDWEYQDALRREEAKEQEREEERLAQQRAATQGRAAAAPDGSLPPGAKRRPGRPRRAMMAVAEPPPEPELDSEQEELINKRRRGPSLSTPQKSRLAQLVAEQKILEKLEGAGEDAESAIQQQLLGEIEGASDGDINMGASLETPHLSSATSKRPSRESSRSSSKRPRLPNLPNSHAEAAAGLATHCTSVPIPVLPARAGRAKDRSTIPPSHSAQPWTRPRISTTPIPLPPYCHPKTNPWLSNSRSKSRPSTGPRPQVETRQDPASTPLRSDHVYGQSSSPAESIPSRTGGGGFTPIGGTFTRPSKRPAEDSPVPASVPAKRKPKKSKKLPEIQAEHKASINASTDLALGEQEYIVKRLEDDRVHGGVHWFLVRWEGDWPDEDNPTWEPRENISEALVKQYLKRKAKRKADGTSSGKKSSKKPTNSLAEWARQFGSVAEAFDGPAELNATGDEMLDPGDAQDHDAGANDGPDELLVIDENEAAEIERRKVMRAQAAAQFANTARAAPGHF